ncbi:MAG: hypothetical protein JWM82_3527 [Myxococcales bacterium]|nr:hypothetical protein [Myxococcales bacterium]
MSRGGTLALTVAVSLVGCTEATPPAPDGGSGGAAGGQMMFVPYRPSTDGGTDSGGGAGSGGRSDAGAETAGAGGAPGTIPATMLGLLPVALSFDGSVVGGTDELTGQHAMMWTSKGARLLRSLAASHDRSQVTFVSPTGIVYGFTSNSITGERQAALWSPDAELPSGLVSSGYRGDCSFVPTAGSSVAVIAATCTHASGVKEAHAVISGLPVGLGFLPGDTESEALLVSGDGSTIAGASYDKATKSQHAFLWTQHTGMTELPPPSDGDFALPRAMSSDGSVVAYDAWLGTPTFPGVAHPMMKRAFVLVKGTTVSIDGCATHDSRAVAMSARTGALLGACVATPDATPPDELPFVAAVLPHGQPLVVPNALLRVTPVSISAAGEIVVGLGHPMGAPPAVVVWRFGAAAPAPMMMMTMMMSAMPAAPAVQPVDVSIAALCENGTTLVGARTDADGSRHGWLIHP